MSSINTKRYRNQLAKRLYDAIDSGSSNFYVAIGHIAAWDNENAPPLPTDDFQSVSFGYWRDMLAAKQVSIANTSYVVARRDWVANTVYTQYDDTNTTIFSNNFFVLDTTNSPYRVYKCLWNNSGTKSTVAPSTTGGNTAPVATGDGYVWQYMYHLGPESLPFLTTSWMPVVTNGAVSAAALAFRGHIPTAVPLIINDRGANYNPIQNVVVTIIGDGANATVNGIIGSGNITISANVVTNMFMYSGGEDYTQINSINVYQFGATSANVRSIIPPFPNHGYDPITELGASALMFLVEFANTESGSVTTDNDYRRVMLLADPKLYGNTALANGTIYRQTFDCELVSNSGVFLPDNEIVVTSNTTYPVTASVVDVTSNGSANIIRLTNVNPHGRTAGASEPLGGSFLTNDVITCNASGVTGVLGVIDEPELSYFSGDILYVNHRTPISRSGSQIEVVRLVFRFG